MGDWCRASIATSRSGCRNAITCRRWKAGSIQAMSPSCMRRLHPDPLFQGTKGTQYNQADKMPIFEVAEFARRACSSRARRNAEDGNYYWRITPWIMPFSRMIPPYGDNAMHGHAWVPIDDENCLTWTFTYHPTRAADSAWSSTSMRKGGGIHVRADPRHVPAAHQQGQRLPDGPRGAEGAAQTFSGVAASPCRTPRCRKAWGRS